MTVTAPVPCWRRDQLVSNSHNVKKGATLTLNALTNISIDTT